MGVWSANAKDAKAVWSAKGANEGEGREREALGSLR